MRTIKTLFTATAVIMILSAATVGYAADKKTATSAAKSDVVATVNGEAITRQSLVDRLIKQAGSSMLEQMIDMLIIKQAAVKAGIKITDAEVNAEVAEIRSQFPNEAAFEEALKRYKLDLNALKADMAPRLMLDKLTAADTAVTDDEIKKHYDENKQRYTVPETVRARHILVKTEKEARKALEQLKSGDKKFDELAAEISIDPGSKANGGDLGTFIRGQMVPEFEMAAFAVNVGEISDIVKTNYGYHIIKVEAREAEREMSLTSVKDEIKKMLMDEKRKAVIPGWIQEQRSKAKVEITL
ncbi:MAG: peptidylprolyl isomerase [bacterium]|jgi:foldase protein PrsA